MANCEYQEASKEYARNLRLRKEEQMRNPAKAKKNGSRPPLPSKKKDFIRYTKKSSTRQKKYSYAIVYKSNLYNSASIILESEET